MSESAVQLITQESTLTDLKDGRVPKCLFWTTDDVIAWIENIGFPEYRNCIVENRINGRKLCRITVSSLPQIGITSFSHIKVILNSLSELMKLNPIKWDRRIAEPPMDSLGMYLLQKSISGTKTESLSYESFMRDFDDAKWQPPLSNQIALLPRD